jgi:arsenical pump membrane protein
MVSLVKVKLIKTLLNVTSFGNVLARRVKQKGVTVARQGKCAHCRAMLPHVFIWAIAGAATAGVILRPFGMKEVIPALAGAALIVVCGLLPPEAAWRGMRKGTDVYLFLTGMMLLSETARGQGLFDWFAAHAARRARGSGARLFLLIYGMGVIVTVFLSNDATAVVLTPAVAAAARQAKAADPLPYLLACAFIANAASFVLPISNPANLVIYQSQMPDLARWLAQFLVPSIAAVVATFLLLRWTERRTLAQPIETPVDVPALSPGGMVTGFGITGTALVLILASAFGLQLGLPTALAGAATTGFVALRDGGALRRTLKDISWSVLALVAGLFVLVTAVQATGVIDTLAHILRAANPDIATWGAGLAIAFACNLLNNLPAGLIAGTAIAAAHAPDQVRGAALIGIDLGPNLSVTGSLATILWLSALRREGLEVSAWTFLKRGALVMPVALFLALAALRV